MKFIRVEGTNELEAAICESINTALAKNKPVVWLVPGGSNIAVAVKVMSNLEIKNLKNLTVVLTDERFGAIGHLDSNFSQLHKQGFKERGARFIDLLHNGSFEDTVMEGSKVMQKLFEEADTTIGFFGMGQDGHIAGILPHSLAAVPDEKWMIGYDDGQYMRFTLTPFAISHVDQAYLCAFGEAKLPALNNLHDKMLPIAEQPAQILCHIPDVYVYSDQIGEN